MWITRRKDGKLARHKETEIIVGETYTQTGTQTDRDEETVAKRGVREAER